MYPVIYEADYLRDRNRLTTFFRPIVAIPWIIVSALLGLAAFVVVVIAWFALIILGRYPEGMYNFVGGVLRYSMRVTGFLTLQTDAWPPFALSEDPEYPVRIRFAPPAGRQSRLKALFRIILVIPLALMSYLFSTLQQMIALVAWATIVFRGYQPAAIHNALAYVNGWNTRVSAYAMLMRDEYPPVGDEVPVDTDPPATLAAPAAAAIDESAEGPPALSDPAGVEADPPAQQPPAEEPPRGS